jgi:hypothetical protein
MISKQELSLYESVFFYRVLTPNHSIKWKRQSFDSKSKPLHKMEEADFSEAWKLTNM